jgi:hypothetical protein
VDRRGGGGTVCVSGVLFFIMKKQINRVCLFFFTLVIVAAFVAAQERYVRPVDEAKLDASFLAFRTKLIAAAERRDAKYILSILDPQIKLSFGDDAGVADFKRIWKIDSKDSEFWGEFLRVIKNGGAFDRENGKRTGTFYAPYTFQSFPTDIDAFDYFAIFGSDVNLRKSADANADVVTKLSFNIVKIEDDLNSEGGDGNKKPEWRKIRTLGGLTGFVKAEFVRSPIDFRAGFEKKRGVWKMVAFIAGD